ncbi:MAG: Eco57I restriction-modification methylase domain-containing protein, partial [Chitinophagales bacterium]|nr:Eco57I restriction-modification methylase domain-containing protein [Chitinophagales bacterium]
MTREQIKQLFNTTYSQRSWISFLAEIFPGAQLFERPQPINEMNHEIATRAYQLGNIILNEDGTERSVAVYEVQLQPGIVLERNRVGLRNLLRKHWRNIDGAFIVFYQAGQPMWRFSYVSELTGFDADGNFQPVQTEPKRYTYVLGPGESVRTAAERFEKLKGKDIHLNDLFDAFSVEKLNKEFFQQYKAHFEKFCDHLAENKTYRKLFLGSDKALQRGWQDDAAKPIRDFVKILLGRLVFLQFLEKKGWMGVPANRNDWSGGDPSFVQNLFQRSPDRKKFHSRELRTLFFETLNTKRKNDLAPSALGSHIKIPYLNGGLFDKDISYRNAIDFPAELMGQLLDFFEQYNFTIDENDPYDSEVGIDPEMLGHIFENLLEENREKGAFYTPKEIVHYMCRESLIAYLHTRLPQYAVEDFEQLVRNNFVTPTLAGYKAANDVNRALQEVKICDPAIGSGAFPMGLLKEIFECRRLLYGYLHINQPFDPALVKKEIIQNNIYGVDIETGAVEIARLRFWLALVVDEPTPQPLPNLDYKIMQGNSLLESFEGIDLQNLLNDDEVMVEEKKQLTLGAEFEPKQITVFSKAAKQELFALIKQYFDPDDWNRQSGENIEKDEIKRKINDFLEGKIHAYILKCGRDLQNKIENREKLWRDVGISSRDRLNKKSNEYKQYEAWNKQLKQLNTIEEKLIALQNTDDKPFFLWHVWYKDVFDNGGFDIVIGNPPYIQLQRDGGLLANLYQNANFETFVRTGDIYVLFYEKGIQLLKDNGVLCYITSNKWMRAGYGEKLRQYFLQFEPLLLIDLGPGVFENATVDTNILLIKKNSPARQPLKAVTLTRHGKEEMKIEEYMQQNAVVLEKLTVEAWFIGSSAEQRLKEKIERLGKPLKDWDVNIYRGILTGLNEAFIISTEKRNEILANCKDKEERKRTEAIIKPILRGRDIKRYYYDWAGLWVIVIPAGWTNANRGKEDANQYIS